MTKLLDIENHCTEEIESLLTKNIIGTPGKSMVYQQLRTKDKLRHIDKPHFISLKRNDKILGTCCFCERPIRDIKAYYIRYFSFLDSFRSKGSSTSSKSKKSTIKQAFIEILKGNGLNTSKDEKQVFYAYLDPNNKRSARLCDEFQFKEIRKFTTLSFSRFSPKINAHVSKATQTEQIEMRQLLSELYASYSLYSDENLFYENNYYVKKDEKGIILAGIQATIEQWQIFELPGLTGKLLLKLVSNLPWIKRLIHSNFNFIAFEYVYYKEGHEKELEELMESTLKIIGVHSAIISCDNDSPLYVLLKNIKSGLLGKMKKAVTASVIAKENNLNDEEIANLYSNPHFISTMDLT